MKKPIVIIGIPGSTLVNDMAAHLGSAEHPYHTLSIDAPLEGKPVTVAPGGVFWEGVDLLEAAAVFVERLLFPWPQPLLPTEPFHFDFAEKEWIVFQREASALIASALRAAAEVRPVINPPAAAHCAVSPSIALDRLAREGIRVHPWRLEPAPSTGRSGDGFMLDACGRDRWHSPRRPRAGEPALVFESFPDEVMTFIVVGGASVGAFRCTGGASWAEGNEAIGGGGELLESMPEAADLAMRAAAALALDYAAVSIRTGVSPNAVLLCEAGPDLEAWNRLLGGRLATALADHMISTASTHRGASP